MELTNNPEQGTGYTPSEAAIHIESLLDTDTGTTEIVDADSETEVSQPLEDEIESDETEQSDEDSEEAVDETDSETTDEAETELSTLSEDALVDVNGQKLPLKELKNGYLRQSDYTKKTQELKSHMQQYVVQERNIVELRGAAERDIATIYQQLDDVFKINPSASDIPDWETLARDDPYQYNLERIQHEKKVAAISQLERARQMVQQQKEEYERKAFVLQQAQARDNLVQMHPEFGDATKGKALLGEIESFLVEKGFSSDEIRGIADHRIIDIVYAALKSKQTSSKVQQVVKKIEQKPALTMPGSSSRSTSTDSPYAKDLQKLKRTGSLKDAASALSKLL